MHDLIIIGSGPGGYVAAIRAAQLGMRVACVEKDSLGGTCLNIGCIPSKALLDATGKLMEARRSFPRLGIRTGEISADLPAMMAHKDQVVKGLVAGVGYLFKKNKIEHVRGTARIVERGLVRVTASDGSVTELKAGRILIATGSVSGALPGVPFDGRHIVTSTETLSFAEVPRKLIVVGAGFIGVELGSAWNRLGSEVLVVEFLDQVLPLADKEMALALHRLLEKQGMRFRLGTSAESAAVVNGKVRLTLAKGDERAVEEADKVLVAVGRKPYTEGLGLAEAGVQTDRRGFVKVDQYFATTAPGVWAIGDVIGGAMLAHKAEEEGVAAVEIMAGHATSVNYRSLPSVIYTHPELASVGMSEEEANSAGIEVRIGKYPFTANSRAKALLETEGFVKILADARTDRIVGVHILHERASEMIGEATLAMEFAASSEDIARTVHAHPTLPEAVKEAALAVLGRAIHI